MPHQVKKTNLRVLATTGVATALIAAAVLGYGFVSRAESRQEVAAWTKAQSPPTVALAKTIPGEAYQLLTLPGDIEPFNKASIYARVSGYVKSWDADIGAQIKAGDVLAQVDAPELDQQLAQARANLASVRATHRIAALTATRNDSLATKQIVAQQAADQTHDDALSKAAMVQASEANVRQLEAMQSFKTLAAPFEGVVTARHTEIGMLVSVGASGAPLFEVADLHRVRIFVQAPQSASAQLKPGMQAGFELPQFPGRHFQAKIVTAARQINAATHAMLVELQADNAEGLFVGGSYCTVHFQIPTDPNLLRIPATALVTNASGHQVVIVDPAGQVEFRSVTLGRDFGDSIEVRAGLSGADRVVDTPQETLTPGEKVEVSGGAASMARN